MAGTAVHLLAEGQVAVRIDWAHLPDLDDLMLDIWQEAHAAGSNYTDDCVYDDEPTRFTSLGEAEWHWAKISPCTCGDHGWHWDGRSAERWPRPGIGEDLPERGEEPDLIADRPRGRFVALIWGD